MITDINALFERFDQNPFAFFNDPANWTRVSFSTKIGRMAGRTVKFFKKTETKSSTLTSYWSFVTAFSAVIILYSTNVFVFILAFMLYVYATYAFFEAMSAYNEKR